MTSSPIRQRSFFGVMGVIFATVAIIGFAPNSVAILIGEKTNPPLIIHFHAAAMSAWLGLLATQAWLMGSGRAELHMRLGVTALLLAPVVFGLMLVIAFPQIKAGLSEPMLFFVQLKRLLGFGVCVTLGLILRQARPEAHKRLMFLGTFAVLDAAFFRMGWLLPGLDQENRIAIAHAYQLLLLVPFVAFDLYKLGHVHRVFLFGIPIIVGFQVAAAVLG